MVFKIPQYKYVTTTVLSEVAGDVVNIKIKLCVYFTVYQIIKIFLSV